MPTLKETVEFSETDATLDKEVGKTITTNLRRLVVTTVTASTVVTINHSADDFNRRTVIVDDNNYTDLTSGFTIAKTETTTAITFTAGGTYGITIEV
jgi:hypothetical protein